MHTSNLRSPQAGPNGSAHVQGGISDDGRGLALRELLLRIESEYREMPGLTLTPWQAGRLWGLDSRTCAVALATLVERRVLKRTAGGTYVRTTSA